jgi:DNA-binding response OmpR family regulator
MEELRKKVLVVEDDVDIANLEKDYLEINNYDVTVRHNPTDVIELITNNDFSCVILDLMLPKISGFTLCKEIRNFSQVPIIIVSAKTESSDVILGLGLGSDDYIKKPFDPQELVARVNTHIKRFETISGVSDTNDQIIKIDNVEIHKKNYKVFVDGEEVKLANKEFELLLFLATNPNIVFSKETLIEKIWGFSFIADTATVTVHINRIREKIEENPNKPKLIETVWGAGYRFNM